MKLFQDGILEVEYSLFDEISVKGRVSKKLFERIVLVKINHMKEKAIELEKENNDLKEERDDLKELLDWEQRKVVELEEELAELKKINLF